MTMSGTRRTAFVMPNRTNAGMMMESISKRMATLATLAISRACQEKFSMRTASCGTVGAACAATMRMSVASKPTAMPARHSKAKLA